jgi:hypothetical protein
LLDENKKTVVVGTDGVRYNVVTYALPDLGDAVRVVAAVDDGGRSAFKPLVRDFIVAPYALSAEIDNGEAFPGNQPVHRLDCPPPVVGVRPDQEA